MEVFTDGATVGRNGKLGTVTQIGVGVRIPALAIEFSSREPGISNNVAELRAMVRALERLLAEGWSGSVTIVSDSELAVRMVLKRKRSKHPHLLSEQVRLWQLIDLFDYVDARWIPREQNEAADALSKC